MLASTSAAHMTARPSQASTTSVRPRYVLVSRSDAGEVAVQSRIAASHRVVPSHFVDMDPSAAGLEHALVSLSGRPVGIIAIPYASCTDAIDPSWRRRIAGTVGTLRKRGFYVYAAAGNFGANCSPRRQGTVFPASVRGVCAIAPRERSDPTGTYAALDSGSASVGKSSFISSSAATGNAAFRGTPLIVIRNTSDCGVR